MRRVSALLAQPAVFHLMRVMEAGLRVTERGLGIPSTPSWESYLRKIRSQLERDWQDKDPTWKEEEPFYQEVYNYLCGVKLAWRNSVMHVGKS
ncbi:MAG TPA: hypothetical protein VF121_16300 [Thermoanaerobaculia bacterium]|nr:hypothetical protein [Thermoanaerobaculia bacterium]